MDADQEAERTFELEDMLRVAERTIADLRTERDRANELVSNMVEHVGDADTTIERWIEALWVCFASAVFRSARPRQ